MTTRRWLHFDISNWRTRRNDGRIDPHRSVRRADGELGLQRACRGPTCDSADVLYEKVPYPLPVSLEIGDKVLIEGTGAYITGDLLVRGLQRLRAAEDVPPRIARPAPIRIRRAPGNRQLPSSILLEQEHAVALVMGYGDDPH